MLVKLLKNDFIQTGRMYLWVLGVGVVAGGIGALFTLMQDIGPGKLFLALLWNFLLILGALVLEVMAVVVILISTNRSLFTERGYLTFALPVSTLEMLASKFITMVTFMLLSIAEVVGLVYVAMTNMRGVVNKAADGLLEQINMADLKATLSAEVLGLPSFGQLMEFLSYVLIIAVVFLILAMMVGLFVLTVSHVRPFQSKPGFWIPIFLVGAGVACQQIVYWISELVHIPISLGFGALTGSESVELNMTTAITMLAISAGLFFLTNYMLSRKISLK